MGSEAGSGRAVRSVVFAFAIGFVALNVLLFSVRRCTEEYVDLRTLKHERVTSWRVFGILASSNSSYRDTSVSMSLARIGATTGVTGKVGCFREWRVVATHGVADMRMGRAVYRMARDPKVAQWVENNHTAGPRALRRLLRNLASPKPDPEAFRRALQEMLERILKQEM